jgi:hypothetical protein
MFFLLITLLLLPCSAVFAADQDAQRKLRVRRDVFVGMTPITRESVKSALDFTENSLKFPQQIPLININENDMEWSDLNAQLSLKGQHRNCPNT